MGFWPSRLPELPCCYCSLRCWRSAVVAFLTKLRDLAPYAALELVMPGGSVMALLLWLYRRRKQAGRFAVAGEIGFRSRNAAP